MSAPPKEIFIPDRDLGLVIRSRSAQVKPKNLPYQNFLTLRVTVPREGREMLQVRSCAPFSFITHFHQNYNRNLILLTSASLSYRYLCHYHLNDSTGL